MITVEFRGFLGGGVGFDVPSLHDVGADVPQGLAELPDGREVVVIGDVQRWTEFNYQQGDNPYGFQGACGLCSCQDMLNQFGVQVTEADVVQHAVGNGECFVADDPASSRGYERDGTSPNSLGDYGIPAHVERGESLEDLAADLEPGRAVNAGVLWNDASYFENGQSNHAIVVTGVARDPQMGDIEGFFVNDSGIGDSTRFVDANTMAQGWLVAGGSCVVTDTVHAGQ